MKNILLVETKSPDTNIFTRFQAPRLGLVILGTKAKSAGYAVRIVYQEAVALRREHIEWADLVGFSTTTSTTKEGYRLARLVRAVDFRLKRHTPVVFGGVHATFEPDEVMQECDYVLRGEADDTFVPFLDALSRRGDLSAIPGLSHRVRGKVVHNPLSTLAVDMDTVPAPDWSLVEGHGGRGSYSIAMTSRGCPHACRFCSVTPMLGRKYRAQSLDHVMRDLGRAPTSHVFFYDDHFAANPSRTKELLRRIIAERGVSHNVKTFSAQVRVEVARDGELLDLFREAGFNQFFIGFESVNPRTLELYNKGQSVEDITLAIREIHRRRISIHGMFVFGSDADTPQTFAETARFARRARLESVQFLILTPLPGSEMYHELVGDRRITDRDWDHYDAFNAVFQPMRMTPYELQMGTLRAMRRFYSLPQALLWLVRGRPFFAGVRLWGWWQLSRWRLKHRKHFRTLSADSREIFLPESFRTGCAESRAGKLVSEPAG